MWHLSVVVEVVSLVLVFLRVSVVENSRLVDLELSVSLQGFAVENSRLVDSALPVFELGLTVVVDVVGDSAVLLLPDLLQVSMLRFGHQLGDVE